MGTVFNGFSDCIVAKNSPCPASDIGLLEIGVYQPLERDIKTPRAIRRGVGGNIRRPCFHVEADHMQRFESLPPFKAYQGNLSRGFCANKN